MRRHAKVAAGLMLVTVLLSAMALADTRALKGKSAPDFDLELVDGGRVKLADMGNDVVILDFWASWCPPCRQVLPKLQAVQDWVKEESKPVRIYAVNLREDKDKINDAWRQMKLSLPVLMDKDAAVAQAYEVEGIPTLVVIHKGKIVDVHVGYASNLDTQLKKTINDLLK